MSRGSEEGEPLMQMVGDEGGGFKGSLGEEEGVLEGRVVAVKNNFYFLRMDSAQEHANVFGKKETFSSKIFPIHPVHTPSPPPPRDIFRT